jgi:7-cyano-7-deazaguanine synthase
MQESETPTVAVLISGGVESAVLCGDYLRSHRRVQPIYVSCGLYWERDELAAARAFLDAIAGEGGGELAPLVVLDEPIRDVYGPHWSTDGEGVPASGTPDEDVYLPGRNLLLTVKSALWCQLRKVPELALGSLATNPFSDGTPEFFNRLEAVIGQALSGSPRLIRPFARLHKPDVIALGDGLPLELTFSCIRPVDGLHCGACSKCAERRDGFRDAGRIDRTRYADTPK